MNRLVGLAALALAPACGGSSPPPAAGPESSPHIVLRSALEAQRTEGARFILPADKVKLAIKRADQTRVVSTLQVCVSESGSVRSVDVLKSSGYRSYDDSMKQIIARTWKFRPFVFDGTAVPVCSAVTFIYNQRN